MSGMRVSERDLWEQVLGFVYRLKLRIARG